MNKLNRVCFIGDDIRIFVCNTRENIPSCNGKHVIDSFRPQEKKIVYILVKLYNKVNINFNGIKSSTGASDALICKISSLTKPYRER